VGHYWPVSITLMRYFFRRRKVTHTDSEEEYAFVIENVAVANCMYATILPTEVQLADRENFYPNTEVINK
jgi:hypothetical protein